MGPYQYSPLVDETRDIRLLHLHPGEADADLRASISHVSLVEPTSSPIQRPTLRELRATLLPGWQVYETVGGRYIFEHPDTGLTSWTHPVGDISEDNEQVMHDASRQTDQPQYEALSYTWGSKEDPSFLYIESNDDSHGPLLTLQVQQNLASALRQLRLPDASRTLWVDAICINQESVEERNTQVTRMTSIYRYASTVVVWLGPASSDSQVALSALDEIGSQTVLTKCVRRVRAPEAAHPEWFLSESALPYSEDVWRAIHSVLQRPWFDRVWIVQEVQLAGASAIMQCGTHRIPWERFRAAAWCVFRKRSSPYLPLTSRLAALKILVVSLADLNFRHLLYGSSSRLCTDQRDHVYGLLGLASPAIVHHVKPQYESKVGIVYITAFLAILLESQRLDALADCGLRSEASEIGRLPSWVPDWSAPVEEQVGVLNSLYSGSGASSAQAAFQSPDILELNGVLSGTVKVVKAGPSLKDNREALQSVRDWAPSDIHSGIYPNGEDTMTAYVQALSLAMSRDRFPSAGDLLPTLQELENEMRQFIETSHIPADGTPPTAFRQLMGNLKGRSFIVTKEGLFGLGPPKVEPNDLVYTIPGCRDPVVLRATSTSTYQVVGSCYIHGLSDAESLLGALPDPWKFQVKVGHTGRRIHYFHNSTTGEDSMADPRLGTLDPEWEACEFEERRSEAERVVWFRNRDTGEFLNSDPRMLTGALRGRGVRVEKIRLE